LLGPLENSLEHHLEKSLLPPLQKSFRRPCVELVLMKSAALKTEQTLLCGPDMIIWRCAINILNCVTNSKVPLVRIVLLTCIASNLLFALTLLQKNN